MLYSVIANEHADDGRVHCAVLKARRVVWTGMAASEAAALKAAKRRKRITLARVEMHALMDAIRLLDCMLMHPDKPKDYSEGPGYTDGTIANLVDRMHDAC